MIRILHVLGGLSRGGAETMVMNFYRNIDRNQFQFDFVIHTEEHQEYYDEIISLGGRIFVMPQYNVKNTVTMRHLWNEFFNKHPEYGILHSHVRSYASLYIQIAKKHGLKTIIHSHSTSNGKGISSAIKYIMQLSLKYQADYLMACSEEAGKWLFGSKACNKDNFIFLPNAIDTSLYVFDEAKRSTVRKSLEIVNKFVIGHVGRFHEAKNHMFLLDVFAEIHKEKKDSVLLLIGDGELRNQIETKIDSLKLNGAVILTGSRGDVPELLQAMDVFVFPSLWEGLGISVIESQASGLMTFTSDSIPKQTALTPFIKFLPLSLRADGWAEKILNTDINPNRETGVIKVTNAGYDIKSSSKKLMDLYTRICQQ